MRPVKLAVAILLFTASSKAQIVLTAFGINQGTNPTSLSVTLSGVPANSLLVIHRSAAAAAGTITGLKDCSGSSACGGSSTDTLSVAVACAQPNGGVSSRAICTDYICQTALSGTMTVTGTFSGSLVETVEVEAWTGAVASSCLDTTGTNASGTASSPSTVTTSGNIANANEFVTAAMNASSTAPGVGTGYSLIQKGGLFVWLSEYATYPTAGSTATATATYTGTGVWSMSIEAWKALPVAARHRLIQN